MNKKNLTTGIVIVVIIAIVTISASYYQQLSSTPGVQSNREAPQTNEEMVAETTDIYKDGIYEVDGNYISPGGAEEIGVTLTLENGIVTDSVVEVRATRDISVAMQSDFAANYKEQVIGKNIDDVMLTKVSGSSLTPKGFNDAVEKIKEQAKS